jgi:hypothetical protein
MVYESTVSTGWWEDSPLLSDKAGSALYWGLNGAFQKDPVLAFLGKAVIRKTHLHEDRILQKDALSEDCSSPPPMCLFTIP